MPSDAHACPTPRWRLQPATPVHRPPDLAMLGAAKACSGTYMHVRTLVVVAYASQSTSGGTNFVFRHGSLEHSPAPNAPSRRGSAHHRA